MAKSELGQKLVGAVAVGSGDYSTAMIANVVNQAVNQSYGRNDELESDSWGLENMAAAGYDPRELIVVMQVLKKASGGGGRGPDIFASHPDPDHRIEVIKSYLQKRWPSGMPSNLSRGERLR
jgi:predicted Zn-dependent protease